MTWIKLDDTFPDHPKFIAAGDQAGWLWVCGMAWCSRHLTDGEIPAVVLPRLTGFKNPQGLAARLVEVGLWEQTEDGWIVHNYTAKQRTRHDVEQQREGNRVRQQKRRSRVDVTPLHPSGNGVSHAEVTGLEESRGEKSREDQERGAPNGAARPRGSRISETFTVTDEMQAWAESECPGVDWDRETRKFVDWAKSASGSVAVKLDWGRAWKNWIRRAGEQRR